MTFYPPEGSNPFRHPQPVQAEEVPAGGRRRDPGSSKAAKIAWVLVAVLMSVLVISNQLFPPEAPPKAAETAATVTPPDSADPFTLQSKLTVSLLKAWGPSPSEVQQALDQLTNGAQSDPDKVRAAIVTAEVIGGAEGRAAAVKKLHEVGTSNAALEQDIAILRRAYEGDGVIRDAVDRQRIIDHHGWFGKVAAAYGKPDTDPERSVLDMTGLWFAFGLLIVVLTVAVVGGIAALITMLVLLSHGKIRPAFEPPAPGGSVYLEAFPFFIAGFLLLHFGFSLYATHSGKVGEDLVKVQLGTQWVLALFPLYPVIFRKVPFAQWRRDVGLHTGKGLFREIGAGIFGYFAGLPLLALAMAFTLGMVILKGVLWKMANPGQDAPLPYNPVAELVSKGNTGILILFFMLATLWAPLVEETMLRGCVFRHLRSRLPMFGAAVVSALFFGFMHGYNVLLLMPVITIGFTFALMREWRGSLIPTMTAHFLHNFTTLGVLLVFMSALKD